MKHFWKKVFSLQDIKYFWLLMISFIGFDATYYFDLYYDPQFVQTKALIGYGSTFMLAVIWGIFNYIGHIRINVLYQRNHDIPSFVSQLVMNHEEKLELQAYLEDYTQDLENQGRTKDEAAKEAINQFKVQEFSSLSKNTMIFNLHAHYYLGGYAFFAILLGGVIGLIGSAISSLFLLVIQYTLFSYALGFGGLFFIYKLVDAVLYKKF